MSETKLRDLLAVIHRDGGHHTEAVGLEQSCLDAHAEISQRTVALDAMMAERDSLRDALGTAETGTGLIEVARNAHRAEQELAALHSKRLCNCSYGYVPSELESRERALREALEQEREKFRLETLRTSALTVMVRRFLRIYESDHKHGPWSRGCNRCEIVLDALAVLEAPVNAPALAQQPEREG